MRRRLAFEAVESTNALALEAARSGDPGPLWITAEQQLAGRGRRGRNWASPKGNLYASLLLIDPAPEGEIGRLPLVIALGVRDGLALLLGTDGSRLAIKWPNDIMLDGAKCGGILLESERLSTGGRAVVIGCGINIAHKPSDAPYPVARLDDLDVSVQPDAAFEALADGLAGALREWDRGANFSGIRARWVEHALGIGEPCRVNLPNGALEGRFVELDEAGRLVLDTGEGERRAIAAGDVFFGWNEAAPISAQI